MKRRPARAVARYAATVALGAVALIAALTAPGRSDTEAGREAFDRIYRVATHPRCMNCHGIDEKDPSGKTIASRPLVGDTTTPHPMTRPTPHPMNITDRHNPPGPEAHTGPHVPDPSRLPLGMDCTTCHQVRNLADRGTPPGAQGAKPEQRWRMPTDANMRIWSIHTSGASEGGRKQQLCEKWDAFRRSHGDQWFKDHIAHDPLIAWAFEPNLPDGPTPITTARERAPGDLARLQQDVSLWIDWIKNRSCQDLAR